MQKRELGSRTRRQLLRTAGAVGIAGIAGCAGNNKNKSSGNNGGNGGSGSGSGERVRRSGSGSGSGSGGGSASNAVWTMDGGEGNLAKKQYNPFNIKEYQGAIQGYIYDTFAGKDDYTGEYYPYLITDWTVKKDHMDLKLRDGLTWWDGSKVDSKDLTSTLKLEFLVNGAPDTVGKITEKDKKTARIELKEPTNDTILENTVLVKSLNVKHDLYKKYVKELDDASSDADRQKVLQKIASARIETQYGNGPWKIKQVSPGKITLTKYEKHPDADKFNFSTVVFNQMGGGNQKKWGALKTGNLDGTKAFVESNVAKTFPKGVTHKNYPANWGMGLWFNFDDPVLKKREVRQAIAHLYDRKTIAKNSDSTKEPVKIPDGITNATQDQWLGNLQQKMNRYEQNHDKAAKLLKQAGFTKKNGSWHEPNGKKFSLPINTPAGWSDFTASVQTMVSQMKDFGIDSEVKTTDSDTYLSTMWPNGNFRVATYGWAAGRAYPYYTYDLVFNQKEGKDAISYPDAVKVPPVGQPNGTEKTVKLSDVLSKLQSKVDKSTEKELMQKLAWVYNVDLPCLPIQEKQDQIWYNTNKWEFPSKDDKDMAYYDGLFSWLPRQGKLNAK